jgi:hypothetical protein
MKPFIAIAALLGLPVLLKAYGAIALISGCHEMHWHWSLRTTLPLACSILAYAIFVLEGTQSSVILANKQSADTLAQILNLLDIPAVKRVRARTLFAGIVNGAPLYNFIIGRQILIILFAFLFKVAFDLGSLSADEIPMLKSVPASCIYRAEVILELHKVIDNWVFSALLCSALVAYMLQVPAKLVAQQHPMLFSDRIWVGCNRS